MNERPPSLTEMLAEAKDVSELIVDLAYAAVDDDDADLAEEVEDLESDLNELAHDMRARCVMAARSPADAEAMASVLDLVSAIERIGNAGVDLARIVSRGMAVPWRVLGRLAEAEELSRIIRVDEEGDLAGSSLADLRLPEQHGVRVAALRQRAGGSSTRTRTRGCSAATASCCGDRPRRSSPSRRGPRAPPPASWPRSYLASMTPPG